MEKSNQLPKNRLPENWPFTPLPKELNQFIFSFFSKPIDLAKASIISKNWQIFTMPALTNMKVESLRQTINLLSDIHKARKLPLFEIEKHINFLIKAGYKFEALKALQDITCDELKRLLNDAYYCNEEAGNLEQYNGLKALLRHKFKLAGYINGDWLDIILREAMCSDEEKFNALVTLCSIKILLEDYFEVSSIQEEFNLANQYLATLEEKLGDLQFHKQHGKVYLGSISLDKLIENFDVKNQKFRAMETVKQWLRENDYVIEGVTFHTQASKFSV